MKKMKGRSLQLLHTQLKSKTEHVLNKLLFLE